ncbi:unnamed protein product, partial [Rotaria sp. Silwood1]
TSYMQRLLTLNRTGTIKHQLRDLLIDYEELFEIGIPLISDEDHVFEILN